MQNDLTIVIPAYNESASIPHVLPAVLKFCEEKNCYAIVVNDGSKDSSKAELAKFSDSPRLKVVHNKLNKGYGGAIKTGLLQVDTTYAITIDADGQHYLDDVEKLYNEITSKDADMIVGSRKGHTSASYYKGLGKWLIRNTARLLMQISIYDINSGMKIYNAELAKKYISFYPDSMAYSDIIALVFLSQRHLVLETPISIRPRRDGKSTISTLTAFETVKQILNMVMLFNPMRIFFPVALTCILISLAWGFPIAISGRGVSIGSMMGIVTGIIFFILGLISEQLSLIRKK
ncbi:MAG: glycosyltransferase family 2 protein [Bacteroidetes bacterium]|nr:MAG: glycosyltransferase family 2 protein [Bacteroidota bacterium]